MKNLKQIQEELNALYNEFFAKMNIDPQNGLWKDAPENVSVRFATMPFIGHGYAEAPVKILFAAYDLGNDELSEAARIQTFEERHDAVVSNPSSPHIAGTYVTTICLLKDQYTDEWNRILANETKSNISVIKDSPEGVLEHVAMTNRWKFVTVDRIGRQGGSDRVYRNKQAEIELFYKEVDILNPDIVWFQGKKAAYTYAKTLKAQGRKVYEANHPSNHFGCKINGEKIDCRTPKYARLIIESQSEDF